MGTLCLESKELSHRLQPRVGSWSTCAKAFFNDPQSSVLQEVTTALMTKHGWWDSPCCNGEDLGCMWRRWGLLVAFPLKAQNTRWTHHPLPPSFRLPRIQGSYSPMLPLWRHVSLHCREWSHLGLNTRFVTRPTLELALYFLITQKVWRDGSSCKHKMPEIQKIKKTTFLHPWGYFIYKGENIK
jgi:hypothetical protein